MSSLPPHPPAPGYVIPERLWSWLGAPRARAALLWLIILVLSAAFLYRAFTWFGNLPSLPAERHRADGNSGHAQIDFGGQWVMGRMLVTGNGRRLYHRQVQWQVVRAGFPDAGESPAQRGGPAVPPEFTPDGVREDKIPHDADSMMGWFMGADPPEWKRVGGAAAAPLVVPLDGSPFTAIALEQHAETVLTPDVVAKVSEPAVGGPLYPPIHAFYYAPLGLIESPQRAYHLFQVFVLLTTLLAGLGVKVLSRGRVWWSVAALCLLLYPGARGALDLGQNPTLSLCLLIWGWVLRDRGYPVLGGVVWGLLAFKPVWAVAFLVVPLVMRQGKFCVAMGCTGLAAIIVTLPVVGVQAWQDWRKIGAEAAALYKVNDNWIHLSRDLHGIPRRALYDFTKPEKERETPLGNALGWALWGTVFGGTALIYLVRGDRTRATGLGAGFLFLGAALTGYRFMYYDVLLSACAVAVLLADPRPFLRLGAFKIQLGAAEPRVPLTRDLNAPARAPGPFGARMLGYVNSFPLTLLLVLLMVENWLSGINLEATVGFGYWATPATVPGGTPTSPVVKGATNIKYPLDTFLLLALWAWCGWQILRGAERADAPSE